MQVIDWKKFVADVLYSSKKVFLVHIAFLSLSLKILIYSTYKTQIALQIIKEVIILTKYLDFLDVFLKELVAELLECSNINEYSISLKPSMKLLYRLIYSLKLVKLETFKIYIKINLVNSFIQQSKSSAKVPILFFKKPDSNLCLYVNYQRLNN